MTTILNWPACMRGDDISSAVSIGAGTALNRIDLYGDGTADTMTWVVLDWSVTDHDTDHNGIGATAMVMGWHGAVAGRRAPR